MEIYKSEFSAISVDMSKKLVIQDWTAKTENMTIDDFKKDMLALANTYVTYKPEKVLVLQKDFRFIVSLELQGWVVENVAVKLEQVGAKQVAFVVSEDIFASVSVEQTMNEKPDTEIEIKYFEKESEARKWLNI